MGMDVFGRKPTGEKGKYFRNNVWSWQPLQAYIDAVAPDLWCKCEHWDTNDGDGLNDADSRELANRLQAEIASGRTARFAKEHDSWCENLSEEPCEICGGTGTRKPIPELGAGNPENGGLRCNACNGSGHVRPLMAHYRLSTENITEFVAFLRESGGFSIW